MSKGFEEQNPLAQALIDLEYESCAADGVIVEYLRSGKINKDLLRDAFIAERTEREQSDRARLMESLVESYHSNFSEYRRIFCVRRKV